MVTTLNQKDLAHSDKMEEIKREWNSMILIDVTTLVLF